MLVGRVPVQRLLLEQGVYQSPRGVVEELRIVREARLQRELAVEPPPLVEERVHDASYLMCRRLCIDFEGVVVVVYGNR